MYKVSLLMNSDSSLGWRRLSIIFLSQSTFQHHIEHTILHLPLLKLSSSLLRHTFWAFPACLNIYTKNCTNSLRLISIVISFRKGSLILSTKFIFLFSKSSCFAHSLGVQTFHGRTKNKIKLYYVFKSLSST